MPRLTRREIEKRRKNDWGNPSGDPVVTPSLITSRSYAVNRRVKAHREGSRTVSRSERLTTNDRRWDK